MNNPSQCPHFLSEKTETQEIKVEFQLDGSSYRKGHIEPRREHFKVFDGSLNGENLSLEIAGTCRAAYYLALTKSCQENFCSTSNHENCPHFRERTDSEKAQSREP